MSLPKVREMEGSVVLGAIRSLRDQTYVLWYRQLGRDVPTSPTDLHHHNSTEPLPHATVLRVRLDRFFLLIKVIEIVEWTLENCNAAYGTAPTEWTSQVS